MGKRMKIKILNTKHGVQKIKMDGDEIMKEMLKN